MKKPPALNFDFVKELKNIKLNKDLFKNKTVIIITASLAATTILAIGLGVGLSNESNDVGSKDVVGEEVEIKDETIKTYYFDRFLRDGKTNKGTITRDSVTYDITDFTIQTKRDELSKIPSFELGRGKETTSYYLFFKNSKEADSSKTYFFKFSIHRDEDDSLRIVPGVDFWSKDVPFTDDIFVDDSSSLVFALKPQTVTFDGLITETENTKKTYYFNYHEYDFTSSVTSKGTIARSSGNLEIWNYTITTKTNEIKRPDGFSLRKGETSGIYYMIFEQSTTSNTPNRNRTSIIDFTLRRKDDNTIEVGYIGHYWLKLNSPFQTTVNSLNSDNILAGFQNFGNIATSIVSITFSDVISTTKV